MQKRAKKKSTEKRGQLFLPPAAGMWQREGWEVGLKYRGKGGKNHLGEVKRAGTANKNVIITRKR